MFLHCWNMLFTVLWLDNLIVSYNQSSVKSITLHCSELLWWVYMLYWSVQHKLQCKIPFKRPASEEIRSSAHIILVKIVSTEYIYIRKYLPYFSWTEPTTCMSRMFQVFLRSFQTDIRYTIIIMGMT